MNKNGNWRIKNSDEELPQDIQDALNEAMNTYQNENGETLKEAFDKEAGIKKDIGYQRRGYYRKPLTKTYQKEMLQKDKVVYVQGDKLIKWTEDNFIDEVVDGIRAEINYDYPDHVLDFVEHIPLNICGVDGDEFSDSLRVAYVDKIKIIVIDGEEQEILQGYLRGDGSNILYS
jgi:hypothetical protein